MQTASATFFTRADAQMRPINWALAISFEREIDPSASFFTVGVSTVGGSDVIKGTDDVLQNWDKYTYFDYSDRIVTVEWSQSMDPLYSVQSAIGDMVMNNTDGYLSADNAALPFRPVRLTMGFGNSMTSNAELLPQFIGVTEDAPTIDHTAKTVSYHVIDFMSTIYNRPLNQDVILQNVSTDQALDALLQLVGLSPTQYDLDVGLNSIPFLYFDATTKFGDAAQQLMQAEMGRLYMTETGRITFHNRQNFSDTSVWSFDGHNVIDYVTSTQDDIVNVVEITSNVLEVQPYQDYWQSDAVTEIDVGDTVTLPFANFSDPVVAVGTPLPYVSSTSSYYSANTASDNTGTDVTSGLTLVTQQFSTSYLMTFTNTNSFPVYITTIHLFATPAVSLAPLIVREQDDASVAQYDEQVLQIENDFFTDEATMISRAKMILADNADFGQLQTVTVKGNPALQINDSANFSLREKSYLIESGDDLPSVAATYGMTLAQLEALNPQLGPTAGRSFSLVFPGDEVHLGVIPELCVILGIANTLDTPSFQQTLTVRPMTRAKYFTAGVSIVGGTDQVAP